MTVKERLKASWKLFCIFSKIGAFTFGGGYAMIPLIQRETVDHHHLIAEEDILNIVAIAESTPGPIAVNSATFIGYQTAGVLGSVGATLGVVLPSFIFILLISFFLRRFMEYKVVSYAFNGIRAGVLALVIKALVSMFKQCPKGWVSYLIAAGAFGVSLFTDCSVILIILVAGFLGLVSYLFIHRRDNA